MPDSSPPPRAGRTLDHMFQQVTRALEEGDISRAVTLADEALAAGSEDVLFLNLSAFGLEQAGDLEGAMSRLRRALQLAPRDVLVLTAAGRTLSQLGRATDALVCFDAALAEHPDHAPAHHGRGLSLSMLDQNEEARRNHARAAELDPGYADPVGALADHALRDDETELARALAERAHRLQGDHTAAALVLATLDAKAGERARAVARLEALLAGSMAPLHRAAAEQLLGEQLDAEDKPVEAFDAFIRASQIVRRTYGPLYEGGAVETAIPLCRRLLAVFDKADPADWRAAPGESGAAGRRGHVFLVGFVRSGTTLLEQVLASHPHVVALEEQATLRAVAAKYFEDDAGLERLRTMGAEEAASVRAEYWRRVSDFGIDPRGKIFVDKAPLSTLWLPAVAKLFPDAKVLLAIRDPRDVVLSAFRHRFVINALAWPFTDLADTAAFYSALMTLCVRYRRLLPLAVHQHRHEDLVADFDAEVGRICAFLGLEWSDAMRDFAETAGRRDVRTPSKDQVRRPLNREGVGRWRRYGPAVEPMLPILQPWVEHYGYAADGEI